LIGFCEKLSSRRFIAGAEGIVLVFVFLASSVLVPLMEPSSHLATAYGMSDKAPWIEAGMIIAPIIIMASIVGAQLCRKTLTESTMGVDQRSRPNSRNALGHHFCVLPAIERVKVVIR
jgi:hypothetical protein